MTVFKPRSRMVSVRLSEEEYVSLQQLCVVTGARSLSDLTRNAMQTLLNGSLGENALSSWKDEFRAQISTLDRKIEGLAERIADPKTEVGS